MYIFRCGKKQNPEQKKNISCKCSNLVCYFVFSWRMCTVFAIVQYFNRLCEIIHSAYLIGPTNDSQQFTPKRDCLWILLISKIHKTWKLVYEIKTQHKTEYEEQKKKLYVTFVPQLTYDWHGMNESYGRWIEIRMLLNAVCRLCLLVCVCVVQHGSLSNVAAIVAFFFRLRSVLRVYENEALSTVQPFLFAYVCCDCCLLCCCCFVWFWIWCHARCVSICYCCFRYCKWIALRTQAYYCKVPHVFIMRSIRTHTIFMECDRLNAARERQR